jgi:FMN phosphatase YigB (HAD superfamily)
LNQHNIICASQAGLITLEEAKQLALDAFKEAKQTPGYFLSDREAEIVKRAVIASFIPEIHSKSTYIYPQAIKILKQLSNMTMMDGSGNKRYILIALSNWEPNAFNLAKEDLLRQGLSAFDDIMIFG